MQVKSVGEFNYSRIYLLSYSKIMDGNLYCLKLKQLKNGSLIQIWNTLKHVGLRFKEIKKIIVVRNNN